MKKLHPAYLTACAATALLTLSLLRPAAAEDAAYRPAIDPANFSTEINNPYFRLTPGTTYTYKAQDAEGTEMNLVTVTDKTRKVMGVTTRVVWDRVTLNGKLIEETFDWYAQDKAGNVWSSAKIRRSIKPASRSAGKVRGKPEWMTRNRASSCRRNRNPASLTARNTARAKRKTWPRW